MLNASLDFNQLSIDDKNAFKGIGSKTLLSPGTLLFRFALTDHNSEWWSEAKSSRDTFADYIRKRTTVFKHWNIQKYLIIARLAQPVYAFKGLIAPQSFGIRRDLNAKGQPIPGKKYTKPVFWGGGFNQVLIKNITPSHYKMEIMAGVIEITDPIDVIEDTLIDFGLI